MAFAISTIGSSADAGDLVIKEIAAAETGDPAPNSLLVRVCIFLEVGKLAVFFVSPPDAVWAQKLWVEEVTLSC
jgi:hypothetical protein